MEGVISFWIFEKLSAFGLLNGSTSSNRRYWSMSPVYGATAACAAPASGRFGSISCATSTPRAASLSSTRFPASSASASALAADRVLGFDALSAAPPLVLGPVVGSSARALRFPPGLLGGGCGGAPRGATFSLASIAPGSAF
uniref:Uncharacterized protein n=1 Tax=Arundo donax TaxID=35708 RepID=A0A0A9HGR2_ARUDO